MTTGQRIRAARTSKGMTQAELADRLGIPYQSIGQWERDVRKPKYETLCRIAKALEVSVSDICSIEQIGSSALQHLKSTSDHVQETLLQVSVFLSKCIGKYDNAKQNGASEEELGRMEKEIRAIGSIQRELSEHCRLLTQLEAETTILFGLENLSEEGKKRVLEYIEELTEIPKYQKATASPEAPAEPPEDEKTPQAEA